MHDIQFICLSHGKESRNLIGSLRGSDFPYSTKRHIE